ncbi:hypothetical protein AVEN_26075-1, partial [Araneus ventricosus]
MYPTGKRDSAYLYRTPPHAPVPNAFTALVPVDWTWDDAYLYSRLSPPYFRCPL